MTTLHLTRGLPASGKTTFARIWVAEDPDNRVRINRDDIRYMLQGKGLLEGQGESIVTTIQRTSAREILKQGRDVIIDDTNLHPKFLKDWLKLAVEVGAEVEYHDQFLDVPLATIIGRDAIRERRVGEHVIMSMYDRYLKNGAARKRPQLVADELPVGRPYSGTPDKPRAVLVDLDGTVAHNDGHRGFFDWAKVGGDKPHKDIIELVWLLEADGIKPIFVSGRDGVCYEETLNWIKEHYWLDIDAEGTDEDIALFMRPKGDMRKDSIVKLEIFDAHIRDNYDVVYCLDDRNQVVDAYRSMGLRVLQVQEGNF